jgi:hypothetical protein
MKNWQIGSLVVASAALLIGVGAGGRAAIWCTPEGAVEAQAVPPTAIALLDLQPTADAESDNGPGCVESALNR